MENSATAFIALVGRPNVGKSSLLNRMVGEKVAIVSPKPQTTRTRVTGILTQQENQFVFIDTPGLHQPRTKLSEFMLNQIKDSVTDVDVALLVTDPVGKILPTEQTFLQRFRQLRIPAILVINKIDALPKKELMMEKISAFSQQFPFDAVVPISALTGEGVDQLQKELVHYVKEGPHFFPDDEITDQPERAIVAEMIREQLLNCLNEEVPHGVAVTIEQMEEREHQSMLDIQAVIYCERSSHKGIIIGKQGAMLKKVASQARREMEAIFGVKINLQCWVKVKEDWRNRLGAIYDLGFRS